MIPPPKAITPLSPILQRYLIAITAEIETANDNPIQKQFALTFLGTNGSGSFSYDQNGAPARVNFHERPTRARPNIDWQIKRFAKAIATSPSDTKDWFSHDPAMAYQTNCTT
jgi:hypothetical protein